MAARPLKDAETLAPKHGSGGDWGFLLGLDWGRNLPVSRALPQEQFGERRAGRRRQGCAGGIGPASQHWRPLPAGRENRCLCSLGLRFCGIALSRSIDPPHPSISSWKSWTRRERRHVGLNRSRWGRSRPASAAPSCLRTTPSHEQMNKGRQSLSGSLGSLSGKPVWEA